MVLGSFSSRRAPVAEGQISDQQAQLDVQVRQLSAALAAEKSKSEEAQAAKQRFLTLISHEIRSPLNGIVGMATALKESDLDEPSQKMVGVIQSSSDTLLGVLSDLVDLTKLDAGELEVEETSFNLPRLIRETHKRFGTVASEKGLKFDLELGTGLRGHVIGCPKRTKQVLTCLLSNAVKATDRGEINLDVSVEEGVLSLIVSDTRGGGLGDSLDAVFAKLRQTDAGQADHQDITGLDLEISREICRLLGGDLTSSANGENGCVFTATMTVKPSDRDATEAQKHIPNAEEVLSWRKWRVLAAEDNQTNRKVLELLLKRYEFDLRIVDDGAQIVKAFEEAPADIILMDVNMPVLNGIEAAARIRVYERAKRMTPVPIIALTADAMAHQISDYLRRGMDAHVSKPVRREELAGCMARLLRNQAE